jgi:hypothetical protein
MSMRTASELLAVILVVAACGCERARPFDPEAHAAEIFASCGTDSVCVHERWRRDPRDWNLGLRAEVAGRGPNALRVVETERAIVPPDLRESPCFAGAAKPPGLYYRTWVVHKSSAEFPFAVFHWQDFDQAAAGHRRAVAAVADARGDDERLWNAIERDSTLEGACVRFRGKRDRCQE